MEWACIEGTGEEFYNENSIIDLRENDEIDSLEEGFMIGYMEA